MPNRRLKTCSYLFTSGFLAFTIKETGKTRSQLPVSFPIFRANQTGRKARDTVSKELNTLRESPATVSKQLKYCKEVLSTVRKALITVSGQLNTIKKAHDTVRKALTKVRKALFRHSILPKPGQRYRKLTII